MMPQYTIGDPGSSSTLTLILLGVGLVVGIIVAVMLRYPQARREQFQGMGAASVLAAVLGGAAVFSLFAGIAYLQSGDTYHGYSLEDDAMVLHFDAAHTVVLSRDQLRSTTIGFAGKTTYELRIEAADGTVYTSAASSQEALRDAARRIEDWRVLPPDEL